MIFAKRFQSTAKVLFLSAALAACGGTGSTSGGGQAGSAGDTGGSAGQGGTGGSAGQGGTAGSMGGTAGSMGGTAGSGGSTPSKSLADQGTAANDCAPNDGPAISVRIGTKSVCPPDQDATPQAWFLAYPANTAMLMFGQTWILQDGMGNGISITWLPSGAAGPSESVMNGSLKLLGGGAADATFEYSFETMDGTMYAGTATVVLCASMPLCG